MTNADKFTIKEMLVKLMKQVEEMGVRIDSSNEKQDLKIEANTIFRRNTVAITKVVILIVSAAASVYTLLIFGP